MPSVTQRRKQDALEIANILYHAFKNNKEMKSNETSSTSDS